MEKISDATFVSALKLSVSGTATIVAPAISGIVVVALKLLLLLPWLGPYLELLFIV